MEERPPPPKMKQYVWKPHMEPEPKPKPKPKSLSTSPATTEKLKIARMMAYQHHIVSLYVGTLSHYVKQALPNQTSLQDEVASLLQDVSSEAVRIKREAQILTGMNIEHLVENGLESLVAQDPIFLDQLCPRVTMEDIENYANMEEDDDGDLVASAQVSTISFVNCRWHSRRQVAQNSAAFLAKKRTNFHSSDHRVVWLMHVFESKAL
ncbi:hypothetical protein BGZ83_003053 [Gryganskiella cystojenkinii]|nr:hypothetical protein BGZ83_003053 [Gryganskiella cystojenkinii]